MKIMHLSDLHLGRSILEQSLIIDQKYILDQIINVAIEKEIDLVMIAGDIYDKSIPSIEAVNLFSSFLTRLNQLSIKVLVISGNHDSKDRLSFGNELFIDNGIYIEGNFSGVLRCEKFEDEYGNINIYMLPFVKPIDIKKYYQDKDINSYEDAIRCIIDNTDINTKERNIIMVHQFVTASGVDIETSDSETISLGGVDNIDVSVFDKFDYVAMGHIHGAQKLIRDTVRYAGSPLKYSFSEVNQKKSVCILDVGKKENIDIELVDLVPFRDMRVIKGSLEDLLDKTVYSKSNTDDYVQVILTDEDFIIDALKKLRCVYPNILKLEYKNSRTLINNSDISINQVKGKSPLELFGKFYKKQNNIELDESRTRILISIIKEVEDEANKD